jgi:peptide/nickel transport system substrate-binding protein
MKKRLTILLSLLMVLTMVLAGCTKDNGGTPEPQGGGEPETEAADPNKPLVVGYSPFSSKFSPFFAETAYDMDAADMTQAYLIYTDRLGAVVEKGKTGETREYNGTNYTYNGPADMTITENADGTVTYDFELREDMKFSDGEPVTADDVIFTMYVLCDPTFEGSATLFSQPIKGIEAYRGGMSSLGNVIFEAGEDNTDFTYFTEEQQKAYWESYNSTTKALAEDIVKFCVDNGYNEEGDIAGAAANWGFEVAEGGTIDDFAAALKEGYGADIGGMVSTEAATVSIEDLFPTLSDYAIGVKTGDSAEKIEGIEKTGDYSVRVTMTGVSAPAVYQLAVPLAPLHYYGDKAKFDYDNNKFGFDKGDLSSVRAKTTQPMGAGPYKFIKFENGVISYEANENYYLGEPKIKHMQFLESQDQDKLNGVVTGTVDITDPSFSLDTAKAISAENSNGETTGDKITTSTVNNLGYGYIGQNAKNVNVGGKPDSEESKNLRKGIATVLARYRDLTVDSYYGEAASVINYPISDTSWAAPQKTDADYAIAFSKDVNGNDIYTSDMNDDQKDEAALTAALGFFEAAGYTVTDGKLTAAPDGAKLEYEVMIPADGAGDHPSFMLLSNAHDAFEKIGFNLIINDLANSSDLWTKIQAGQHEIWCAAWGATADPDMYQIYYSDVANGGANPGGSAYHYNIADAELDKLIMDARASLDQSYRKSVYKSCLDIIIDWACEIPVYQRQNAIIFSTERVNMDTVTPDITTFYGWAREIQNLELR